MMHGYTRPPEWFDVEIPSTLYQHPPQINDMIAARNSVFDSLRLYNSHAHVTLVLMTGLLGAFGYFLVTGYQYRQEETIVLVMMLAIPAFIFIVSLTSIAILYQYYDLYVAHLLSAAIIHYKAGCIDMHPWLAQFAIYVAKNQKTINSQEELRCRRCLRPRFSFLPYALILFISGIIAFVLPATFGWDTYPHYVYLFTAIGIIIIYLFYLSCFLIRSRRAKKLLKYIAGGLAILWLTAFLFMLVNCVMLVFQ